MQSYKATELTIANAGTTSEEFSDARGLGSMAALTIMGPAALTGTVKLEVSDVVGGTFRTLQSPAGTDVSIAAAKAVTIPAFSCATLRLKSSGAEAADRVFPIFIQTQPR